MNHYRIISFFAALIILSAFSCCSRITPYREISGAVWATSYHIIYRSGDNLDDSVQVIFNRVNDILSPFNPSSQLSRINRGESDRVDSLFTNIFTASRMVNEVSGGLFDPTVAPLVNLWGFGFRDHQKAPSSEEISEALSLVGISRCRIEDNRIIKPDVKVEFDFSAITKGYGCDLIGEMFRRNGCEDFMIEIGGEIYVGGVNPSGDLWHIMIDAPVENDSSVIHEQLALVSVSDCGIATSGNYRNYHVTDSGNIGHTINPLTGMPALRSATLSATVIARNAMLADAFATACMAMEPDSAMTMIETLDNESFGPVSLLLVTAGDDGTPIVAASSTFPEIKKGIAPRN